MPAISVMVAARLTTFNDQFIKKGVIMGAAIQNGEQSCLEEFPAWGRGPS